VITKKIYIAVTLASWHWSSCESKLNVQTTQGAATSGCKSKKSAELCEVATNLSWSESSPQRSVNATAKWTISSSADLSSQKIQLYSDSSCTTALGSAVDLSSVNSSSYLVTVSQYGTTVSFKIQSFTSTGKSGWSACSASMSFEEPLITPEPVTISVQGGFYTSLQTVSLSSKTSDATIFYTLDGSVPTSSSVRYAAPITIRGKKTLKAVAIRKSKASAVSIENYQVVLRLRPATEAAGDISGILYMKVLELTNGNIVVSAPYTDIGGVLNVGAVHLFDGNTGELISSLFGSSTNDQIGRCDFSSCVYEVGGSNFVVGSSQWRSGGNATAGAVTWINGKTGLNGVVSAANSLVGSSASDGTNLSIKVLSNGNYVVLQPFWDCLLTLGCASNATNVGAVTFGNGLTGTLGVVSALTSLIGASASDQVGSNAIPLTNGNAVVLSNNWSCTVVAGCSGAISGVGAATWMNGTSGLVGQISSSNSLIGSTSGDGNSSLIVPLTNGNYVFSMPYFDCSVALGCTGAATDAGAVVLANGASGTVGFVTASNSLIGSSNSDNVGRRVLALTNGNYVVGSESWDCLVSTGCAFTISNAGAVTWRSGVNGPAAIVSASNSLIGGSANNSVSYSGLVALSNGNYVVRSQTWDCTVAAGCAGAASDVGAVTWGDGTNGSVGTVQVSNSIVGSTINDTVGQNPVLALSNGNYVVSAPLWDCQVGLGCASTVVDAGASVWASGTASTSKIISASNSLIGTTASDQVGLAYELKNSNYVIVTSTWDSPASVADVGAATWANGSTGVTGAISTSNSMVGTNTNDKVGSDGVLALSNGNYVVSSSKWNCATNVGCESSVTAVGAATWADGSQTTSGAVQLSNSIVGSSANDNVGTMPVDFKNGVYLLRNYNWDCTIAGACGTNMTNVGALTFVDSSKPTSMIVSALNSIVGATASDALGLDTVGTGVAYSQVSAGQISFLSASWTSEKTSSIGIAMLLDGIVGLAGVLPKD
jgi:hypothetical protein